MRIGVAMFCTEYAIPAAELALALEERGFDSFWAPEHSHIPVSRGSAFPQGGSLPNKYFDVMDPFVSLTAAAVATTTLKIATGICIVPQRDPIQTAKTVASLDQVSNGRFIFGVGPGWNADEMANHGTEFRLRNKVMRERIEAMREIWSNDTAEYHGETLSFEQMQSWPKPKQRPYPPVFVGGGLPHGARRALAYADGWVPHARRPEYRLLDRLSEFHDMQAATGRTIPITAFGAEHDSTEWLAYSEAGIERIVLSIDSEPASKVIPKLDDWSKHVRVFADNG